MTKTLSIFIVLVAQFFAISSYSQEKNVSGDLTKQQDFLASSHEHVLKEYNLKPLDPSQELEKIVMDEMQTLDRFANFSTPVWKTDKATFAHPEVGVAVNLEELKELARRVNIRQIRQYVSFILAHEKTHQFQFLRYPNFKYLMSSVEDKRLYECQADVFAGKLLIETQKLSGKQDDEAIKESLLDALQVAFVMGSEQFSDVASHPSHEERRTAVRLGMTAGILVMFPQIQEFKQSDPALVGQVISEKLNMLPGEDWFNWSLRASKRIIHYKRDVSKDIVLASSNLKWDESDKNPFVTYRYTYKNKGLRTIEIDMEFQCNWVPREDSNNTLLWQRWSEKNYKFKLAPGEQFTASGTLPWGNPEGTGLGYIDPDKLMPRFVAPLQNPRALISFDYADSAEFQDEVEALRLVLNKLINASSSKFKQYRAEAGRQIEDTVIYSSSLGIPGGIDQTSIWVPKDREAYIRASLYKGSDNLVGLKIYNETAVKLKAIYLEERIGEEMRRSSNTLEKRYFEFEPRENHEAKINLSFTKSTSSNSYEVYLTITAPPMSEEESIEEEKPALEVNDLEANYKILAEQLLENLVKTNYQESRKNFNSYAEQSLSEAQLAESWTTLIQNVGAFKRMDNVFLAKEQKYDAVVMKCIMERNSVFVVVVFDERGMINGLAFRPAPPEEITEKQILTYKAISQQVLDNLVNKNFENIHKKFHPETAKNLSVERLSQIWASVSKELGSFINSEEAKIGMENGFHTVYIKCKMERANLMLVVSFDGVGQITALWIRPTF